MRKIRKYNKKEMSGEDMIQCMNDIIIENSAIDLMIEEIEKITGDKNYYTFISINELESRICLIDDYGKIDEDDYVYDFIIYIIPKIENDNIIFEGKGNTIYIYII